MAEITKMTRKQKIEAGVEKLPKRKRRSAMARKEAAADMCKVSLRNYRSSARKVRLVVDQIRGMEVYQALSVLKFTSKASAPAMARLLRSAVASFEEKFDDRVDVGTHYVKEVSVDGGRMLKRLQPAPQGRAHLIRKRYCHVTMVIDEIPDEE
ncbi:MAG: 50S ribosomal protein L22 [Bacteroidia bacterium]